MENAFNWYKWYTPKTRALLHAIFWLLVLLLYYLNYKRIAANHAWIFIAKDFFVVTTLFYVTSGFIISKFILRGKLTSCLIWIIIAYTWWVLMTYFVCLITQRYLAPPQPFLERYITFILTGGLFPLFFTNKVSLLILDFTFLISLPLGPKLMKSLMQQGYEKTKLERDNLELELNFLKSQISPHFLFNTLSNIHRMAEKNDSKTSATVLRLANLMRYILYESKDQKILLSKEVEFVLDYLELVMIRYGEKVSIKADIVKVEEPYKIIPLLLIPFIENAFKHGPDRSQKDSWISIFFEMNNDTLILVVKNSVNRASWKESGGGVGLQNVRRRLDLHYKDRHTLQITEEDNSFQIILTIHLK